MKYCWWYSCCPNVLLLFFSLLCSWWDQRLAPIATFGSKGTVGIGRKALPTAEGEWSLWMPCIAAHFGAYISHHFTQGTQGVGRWTYEGHWWWCRGLHCKKRGQFWKSHVLITTKMRGVVQKVGAKMNFFLVSTCLNISNSREQWGEHILSEVFQPNWLLIHDWKDTSLPSNGLHARRSLVHAARCNL